MDKKQPKVIKNKNKELILDIVLVMMYFCYIFMFNIFGPIDSSILIGIGLLLLVLFNKKYRQVCLSIIKKIKIKPLLIVSSMIAIWSIAVIIVNDTHDISFLNNISKLAVTIIIGYLLYSFTVFSNRSSKIINYIIVAFFIQTVFQCICFAAPSFSNLFNYFRDEGAVNLATKKYAGYRGLALSKTPFFTLSISYAIVFILYMSKFNTLFLKHKVLKYLFFIILLLGNVFAGRVGFVGLLFAPFAITFQKHKWQKPNKRVIISSIIITIGIVCAIAAVSSTPQAKKLYNYVFEATNNLFSGEGINTKSTNGLIKMFDRQFSTKTLLVGDGKYRSKDGYYMKTDVGYYRKIYFGGITILFLMIVWHLLLAGKNVKTKEYIIITIFLLIVELKGVTICQNSMVYAILVLFILYMNDYYEKLHINIKASVLLPTLNTKPEYLKEAISSILNQTHENFELIIVVDGGNDDTIIDNYFCDKRITIVKHKKTQGIAKSLNDAIKESTGKYLIRMDADDISMQDRLEKQIIYMEEHPEIDVSGTFIKKFGKVNKLSCEPFTSPSDINAELLFNNPLAHPTVILRKETIKNTPYYYYQEYERAEDYELWQRMASNTRNITIMKYYGLRYRTHSKQISSSKRTEQLSVVNIIHSNALRSMNIKQSSNKYLLELSGKERIKDKQKLNAFIKIILKKNKQQRYFNQRSLRKVLYFAYSNACIKNHLSLIPNRYFILASFKKTYYKIICLTDSVIRMLNNKKQSVNTNKMV